MVQIWHTLSLPPHFVSALKQRWRSLNHPLGIFNRVGGLALWTQQVILVVVIVFGPIRPVTVSPAGRLISEHNSLKNESPRRESSQKTAYLSRILSHFWERVAVSRNYVTRLGGLGGRGVQVFDSCRFFWSRFDRSTSGRRVIFAPSTLGFATAMHPFLFLITDWTHFAGSPFAK